MARRIYKGCTIEHRLNLPVSNIDDLEYLSILLHTKEDNDIIKTYPNDIAFKNDEFVFTISSDDIVFLQEGILWATIDMRVSGVDTNKKIQLPYYIKYECFGRFHFNSHAPPLQPIAAMSPLYKLSLLLIISLKSTS